MTLIADPIIQQTESVRPDQPVRRWPRRLALVALVLVAALGIIVANDYRTHLGRKTTDPEFTGLRTHVTDNTLVSDANPDIEMSFNDSFTHIGGQKFVLYGTADTEQHFFVEEHPDGSLKSMFWVQFESFLPDNEFRYDYSASPLRTEIGGFDFFTDTAPGTSPRFRPEWPGTDGGLMREFIGKHGYSWPDEFSYARLVHIPDRAARHEMLIIVVDDLAPLGLTGGDLRPGGDHEARWSEIEAGHLDWINSVMTLRRPDDA